MPTIVDQIRKALEKRDGLSEEIMAPLATAYAGEVDRVNQRLSEAVDLLRKGLRSEAIQRASMRPNALDGAAELDFPEVAEWFEILMFLGVPVPALVDQDAAQQLNEAIVETQPLNELLRRHRKLAIAKAPLAWRLKVLRRIAQVDPMNPVWEEDLESWEEARLKQIPAELQRGLNNDDTNAVQKIHDELTSQSWRVEPSARLVEQVSAAAQQFSHAAHTEQLNDIAPVLYAAFGEFDEALARQLRENWRQVQAQMTMPVPVDLQEQVAPVFVWLDELDRETQIQQQRAAAIGELESALDHEKPVADLQRAYSIASRYDEPIPVELEQRFRVVVAEHEIRSKRKSQAILVAIVAATLLVGASIAYWQWNANANRQVASAASQMKALLDEGKRDEAEQFWNQIEASQPSIASSAAMTSLHARLTGEIEKEQDRDTQFTNYLAQAQNDDPGKIDISALNNAESLAVTEAEKAEVFKVQRKRNQWERELQALHTGQALEKVEDYRKQLSIIDSGTASIENIKAISILIDEVEKLGPLYPRRASSVDAQADLIKSRATAMRSAMQKRRSEMEEQKDALDKVLNSVSFNAFADNLAAFARDLPNAAMATEFTKVAQERTLWEQAFKSNDFVESLQLALKGGVTPANAKSLITAHKKVTGIVVTNPILDPLSGIDAKIETIQSREALLDRVFNDLSLQTIAELMTVEVAKRNDPSTDLRYFIYYSHFDRFRDRLRATGIVGIEVVVNASGAVKNQSFNGPVDVIPEPRDTVRWLIRRKIDNKRKFLTDWNGAFLEATAELRKRPKVDGMVKELLLLHLLKGCTEGSEFAKKNLAHSVKFLERRDEERQRWFVPKVLNDSLDPMIEQIVVPEMSRTYQNRSDEWRDALKACQRRYQWIGFLLRGLDGQIVARIQKRPEEAKGRLYVIRASVDDPSKVEFSQVGTWENDGAVLRASIELVAGRPLIYLDD